MASFQHTLKLGSESITVIIKETSDDLGEYTIESDSPLFEQIFTFRKIVVVKGHTAMEELIVNQVIPSERAAAFEIMEQIKKVI